MMSYLYGLGLGFIAWMLFALDPAINTSWLNEMLGLSELEAGITAMFFIVGIMIGSLEKKVDKIANAHDRLVNKVHDLSGD